MPFGVIVDTYYGPNYEMPIDLKCNYSYVGKKGDLNLK